MGQRRNSLVPRSRLPRIACRNFIDDEMAFAGILASSSLFASASIRGWWRYFRWGHRYAERRAAHNLVHQKMNDLFVGSCHRVQSDRPLLPTSWSGSRITRSVTSQASMRLRTVVASPDREAV